MIRMTPSIALLLLGLSTPALLGAVCMQSTTHVERGELYTTGDASYDEFFKQVQELRTEAVQAEADKAAARGKLSRVLGLDDKSDEDATLEATHARAKMLLGHGVRMHLTLTPEPKLIAVKGAIPLDGEGEALVKAVEEAATEALKLSRRLGAWPSRVTELEKKQAELRARFDEVFKKEKPVKKGEISKELDAAKDVIADSGEAGERYSGLASKFVIDLAAAVETGGAAAVAERGAASASASAKAPPRFKGGPPKGWKPPAGAGTPPPPPRPKPAGGDDFDP